MSFYGLTQLMLLVLLSWTQNKLQLWLEYQWRAGQKRESYTDPSHQLARSNLCWYSRVWSFLVWHWTIIPVAFQGRLRSSLLVSCKQTSKNSYICRWEKFRLHEWSLHWFWPTCCDREKRQWKLIFGAHRGRLRHSHEFPAELPRLGRLWSSGITNVSTRVCGRCERETIDIRGKQVSV